MENHTLVFTGHGSYQYGAEVAASFHSSNPSFSGLEDGPVDASLYIDPSLQSPSPSAPCGSNSPWEPPQQVRRFLRDPQKTAFFNTEPPKMNANQALLSRPTNVSTLPVPLPASSSSHQAPTPTCSNNNIIFNKSTLTSTTPTLPPYGRYASPISTSEPSSISSADDTNFPATPPDTTLFSPYGQPMPFDHHDRALHFMSMGPTLPSDSYVNPHDVNQHQIDWCEAENSSSTTEFTLTRRPYSFESYTSTNSTTSHCDFEPAAAHAHQISLASPTSLNLNLGSVSVGRTGLDIDIHLEDSDDDDDVNVKDEDEDMRSVIKEEIQAATSPAITQYPPAFLDEQEVDNDDSDLDPDFKPTPQKGKRSRRSEDTEYKPNKRARTNGPSPSTRRSGKGAMASGSGSGHNRMTSQDLPARPAKKAKTGGIPAQVPNMPMSMQQQQPQQPMAYPHAQIALPPASAAGSSSSSKGHQAFTCRDCPQLHFKDQAALDAHTKKQHTRPFVCVFHFSGCESTFASKNEWKRHVNSQHLLLNYWLCQEGTCGKHINSGRDAEPSTPVEGKGKGKATASTSASSSRGNNNNNIPPPNLPNGAIFNRKDLYTQHLRRMHMPPQVKKVIKQKGRVGGAVPGSSAAAVAAVTGGSTSNASFPEWEKHVKQLQERARQIRCQLPDNMECPAAGCATTFSGADAWDQRMEHVARHLEKAASGEEQRVTFGGAGDPSLMKWAARADVAVIKVHNGRWELNNPLKSGVSPEGMERVESLVGESQREMGFMSVGVADEEEDDDEDGSEEVDAEEGEEDEEDDAEAEIIVHDPDMDAEGEYEFYEGTGY